MYWWNKYLCLLQFWNLFETGIVVINPKCSDKIILSKFQSWKLSWSSREKPWTRTTRCGRIFSLVKLSKVGSRYVFLSLFTSSLLVFLVCNLSALSILSLFSSISLSLSLSLFHFLWFSWFYTVGIWIPTIWILQTFQMVSLCAMT